MKYNFEELEKIMKVKSYKNISEDEIYTHLNVCKIYSEEIENDMSNVLFFPTYVTKEENIRDGWYINEFNRRKVIQDIIKNNPKWTYVLDEELLDSIEKDNVKFIEVEDIRQSIDDIYNHRLESVKAKVIAVTGTVGKTSTIGMIHDVIKKDHNALRLYSKRLTPLNIKGRIINYLEDNTEFITLEMSIYKKDHVEKLANLLPPYMSAILNIGDSHTDQPGLESRDKLAYYKSKIFLNARKGIVNIDDKVLSKLKIFEVKNKKKQVLALDDEVIGQTKIRKLQEVSKDGIYGYKIDLAEDGIRIFNESENHIIKPYIYSKLSVEQALISLSVALNVGIDIEDAVESINNYRPVEKRLNKEQILGKDMFFDADITSIDRMNKVAENYYKNTSLILRKINIGEKDGIDEEKLVEIFAEFNKVYVYEDSELSNELLESIAEEVYENIKLVDTEDLLLEELENNDKKPTTYFYHYGGYYRKFKEFDEENLRYNKKEILQI